MLFRSTYNGNNIIPYQGISLKPVFDGGHLNTSRDLCFEHFEEKALIDCEGWKIVQPANKKVWELYDLNTDRSELHNLAAKYPERVAKMIERYLIWEDTHMVNPRPGK